MHPKLAKHASMETLTDLLPEAKTEHEMEQHETPTAATAAEPEEELPVVPSPRQPDIPEKASCGEPAQEPGTSSAGQPAAVPAASSADANLFRACVDNQEMN